jgi:Predicted flavin-nucleotide-binding protein
MERIPPEKFDAVSEYLQQPLIARIATADPSATPHVVPVWYGWDGQTLWISSFKNTRKIGELEKNPAIAVSIDTAAADGSTRAVIFEGQAKLIREPRELVHKQSLWIYTRYLGTEGAQAPEPQSWIVDPLNQLITLTPERVYLWGF